MTDLLDLRIIPRDTSNECVTLDDMPLAYSYVPYQSFELPQNKEKSLKVGTIFPSLNKPLGVYGKEFSERMCGR